MQIYRALLRLYPKSFRAEYGAEMEKDFARQWRDASPAAKMWLVLGAALDTAWNAARVHGDITKQDVRYSLRSLGRTPGFAITVIVVAALGIGATTAAFSLADHVLIRALPFPESDRIVKLWQDFSKRGYPRVEPSPPNFLDWQRQATVFERLEAYTGFGGAMTGRGEAVRLVGATLTPGMLQLLGRPAAVGRIFTDADTASADAERPMVISDRLWRTAFASNPDVVGQTLTLDGATYSIVGVMPSDFFFPSRETDFWRMLRFSPNNNDTDRTNQYLEVLGRLKDGVSLEDARAEMRVIGNDLARLYPKELEGTSATLASWREVVSPQARLLLLGLVGASICVLLIACTNLANLLMSRALARRTEFAVRAAVGASVDRLVRQMLTDSLILAFAGGALGVLVALTALPLLVRLVPTALPIAEGPPADLRMLVGTLVLTTLTGLAFGLLPALRVCRRTDASALKDGTRGGTSRGTERVRSTLVVAEIVASVVLIVCVGLLTQALLAVQGVDPGFRADNVLTLRTNLPIAQYGPLDRRLQFYSHVLDRVHALPGVRSASYISWLPMTFRGGVWEVLSPNPDRNSPGGFAPFDGGQRQTALIRFVTPQYFETVGTPILKGRDISAADTVNTPFVAVVSDSFARRHFPNQDPIGRSFGIGLAARTVVGVVGDTKIRGLERLTEPQVYMPAAQQTMLFFYAPKDLVIRTDGPATALAPAVRAIIAEAAPDLPVTGVQTMEQLVAGETAPRVTQLRVLGGFAAIALLLAGIGIHGLLAFTVTARAREIGVRIALGAKAGDILRMVIGRSVTLTIIGVVVGAALAYAAGRSMQAVLFGVDPANATVFAASVALAAVMALAGSLLPAWRAIRVDPIEVTRSE
ncbi:MAG TPA: ABC transporter permease [Vicinamibacterales bacterium]|nr:ABC transporter permease [Vicinamibacterales bacterium]